MAEIKTPPIKGEDENGDDVVCFNSDHTISDIVRWLMENPVDAEEALRMLSDEVEKHNSPLH